MRTFSTNVLIAFGVLFLTLSSTVWIDYAHHDSTHHFMDSNTDEFKSDCRNYDAYAWTYAVKRPIAAEIECQVFKNTRSLRDLGAFRAYMIAALALAVALTIISIASDGSPEFWIFMPLVGVLLAMFMFLMPNLNTAALEPMGEIAGTASSSAASAAKP